MMAWEALDGHRFMNKVQEQKLAEEKSRKRWMLPKLSSLVNVAILKTRELARGLFPVVSDAHGLCRRCKMHAAEIEDLFGFGCRFQCDTAVLIHDGAAADPPVSYRPRAVKNAIKHGHARNILIRLFSGDWEGTLIIEDDGDGIERPLAPHSGVGLHIMNYRAGMIGGNLDVRREQPRGTAIVCVSPWNSPRRKPWGEGHESRASQRRQEEQGVRRRRSTRSSVRAWPY